MRFAAWPRSSPEKSSASAACSHTGSKLGGSQAGLQLRAALLLGRTEAECALCGEKYPARFLWASHIKKRAAATDQEARDIPRVAMLACVFGCDALFEDGYVSVENGTIFGATSVAGSARCRHGQSRFRRRSTN